MCSMSSFTETTGFMSPHNAACGAAAGGCDDFAEEQAELPADRAASVQATTIVRNRLEGMSGENTTVVGQNFLVYRPDLRLRSGHPKRSRGAKACTTSRNG